MLQSPPEHKQNESTYSLLDDADNDIAGSSCPSRVTGVIFDVGSTLFCATEKTVNLEMENGMKQTLQTHFKWNDQQLQLFWKHFNDIHAEYDSKKLFVGTGCCLDEGWWAEPTTKSWIIGAIKRMNLSDAGPLDESDAIFDAAIAAFRTPRVENASLIPNVLETIQQLRQRYGVRCAICSNDRCASRLRETLKNNGVTDQYFDQILISAEVGKRKPDVRIVEPILRDWQSKFGIRHEEVIFVGDKLHTDIQAARHLGLRAVHCQLYNRQDTKYKTQKKRKPNPFELRNGAYLGAHADELLHTFNQFHLDSVVADDVLTDYTEFIVILRKLAATNGVIARSGFDVFRWRPLVIGVLLRPQKCGDWCKKRRLFEVKDYRKDIVYKAIDITKDIASQGPFDIILHKLNWFHFNARFDENIQRNLNAALIYFKSISSNLRGDDSGDDEQEAKQQDRLCYISDDPQKGMLCQDRWYVYNTVNGAEINVSYDGKEQVHVVCPKSILLTFEQIQHLKAKQKVLNQIDSSAEDEVFAVIKKMKFPLFLKPRTSGRTPTNRYDGHCLHIVPTVETFYTDFELFDRLLRNEKGDWICQEYIDHGCGCHKVYNLGYFVFASINHSTSRTAEIEQTTKVNNQAIQVSSTGVSSQQFDDQSKRDALSKNSHFYSTIAKHLKHAFGVNLFGFDLIFDADSNVAYIVDVNFMPSFKIVPNFHTILTEYLLYEYHQFVNRANQQNKLN